MTVEDITFMMSVFHKYQRFYYFKVRTGKECLPEKRGNLEVTNDFLPQQEILCKYLNYLIKYLKYIMEIKGIL